MTAPPRERRIAIVDIIADSSGSEVIPPNARFVGSESVLMQRVIDSRARRSALTILNDAEHAKGQLHSIRQREHDVAARERAVQAREDAMAERELLDALHKFDSTLARFDAYEAKVTHDPDDDELPLPPGIDGTDPVYDPSVLAHPQKPQQQPAAIGDEEDLPLPPGSPAPDDGELEIPKTAPLRDPVAAEDD
jgi:hypothetical protein